MIAKDQIKELSLKYQTLELNIRREYFQHLFLSYFYQQPQTDLIYFKGGTALRIIYRSPRFSEDLDFSTALKNIKPIEQAILHTLGEVEKTGILTDFSEAKKTSGGYLAIITFKAFDKVVTVQLHISLRQGVKSGEVVTITNDFIPSYTIIRLAEDQLVDEKIQALETRKKPRDFYDLYFILRANLLSPKKKNILKDIIKTVQKTEINFTKELKQFLPKSQWAIIRDFKKILMQEIRRFI